MFYQPWVIVNLKKVNLSGLMLFATGVKGNLVGKLIPPDESYGYYSSSIYY